MLLMILATSLYTDYGGTDELLVADGKGLPILHTGSTIFPTKNKSIKLSNVLHVPSLKQNLISVSKLCKTNNLFVKFFPNDLLVKDLATGATMMRGSNQSDLYVLGNGNRYGPPQVFISSNNKFWHKRLGHPAPRTLSFMLNSLHLSKTPSLISDCNSRLCNKSHKLPFNHSSFISTKPLELIFSDVWEAQKYNL